MLRSASLLLALASASSPGTDLADDEWPDVVADAPVVIAGLRPGTVITVSGDELLHRGYRTLGDALRDVAGVSARATNRGPSYGLRGIEGGLALVVDGVPVDRERGLLDLDGLALWDVERVEVTRGPASSIHGVNTLSGVVAVTTKRPGVTGAAARAGGTHHLEREVAAEGSLRADGLAARASVFHREGPAQAWLLDAAPSRFIRVGSALVPGSRVSTTILPADDDATTARLTLTSGVWLLEATYGRSLVTSPLSSFSQGVLSEAAAEHAEREGEGLRLAWAGALGPIHLDATGHAERHHRTDHSALYPAGGAFLAGGAIDLDEEVLRGGLVLRGDVALARDHRLIAELATELQDTSAHSRATSPITGVVVPELAALDDRAFTASLALEYQADLGAGWHATAGLVAASRTSYAPVLAPRAAIIYVPDPRVTLHAAYAEGWRAPDPFDLVALSQAVVDGQVLGARANPDLRPERTRTGDLGVSLEPLAGLGASIDLFLTRHEAAIHDRVDGVALVPENLPARLIAGGEAELTLEVLPSLLAIGAGLAVSRVVQGDPLLADQESLLGHLELTPTPELTIGGRVRFVHAASGLEPAAGGVVDLFVSDRLFSWLTLDVAARNFGNLIERSVDPDALGSGWGRGVPSPDRIFSVELEGRW